ncbi:MAG: hypothetical protein DRP65_00435 [Planctomycetota bacterium]|nr:MAG: hypothetical protein DRP65_00435 [Planctomycetota bacterium]
MAQLVAKTSAAIAVDDSLTTLIDWMNIESLAGFTVVVENAGGGSANDIADVQIDTSDDGGVTENLDQHAGVPAVPITSGDSKIGTFTETAKFVRIRTLCAAGEDTTANAILLADSATGRICTLADVKERLGITDTDHDQTLNRILLGIESLFDGFTGRSLLLTPIDVTEYYTGCGPQLQLKRYPVISVTSIKQALDYDFDSATALTADSDYRLINNGKDGILYSMYAPWFSTLDCIQVIYRGGYCAAGLSPGPGETAMPADLREAAIEQATFIFKRKDDIGLAGVGFEGGSISKFSAIKLLPMVEQILKKYRRPQL